ncbi:Glyoxalase/bleomycin resistance protein/dioxygenase [Croceitalea dokdonensis DOKDO 023]|uniref:Glyoxalase/bleomycin resistance protein/dioxygenase n=1 Tax=Croceitalea dokdonensis DOKDO 023 TaxID=1300341 RepID=A0A0P7A7V8_9FLAO|nr:VOC family protein [Croceitalea dokdonensis]KPM32923.1 Glyoxalase/bleomycin resistance protein/dioxygenase [Croceitalea dokdonensis DOKDO 023]
MSIPINYIEFKSTDLDATKAFYSAVFGWTFTDYGATYTAFTDSGVEGGFEFTNEPIVNGVLVVLHHDQLEAVKENVLRAGGTISVDIFSFPGGKRFQFLDPSGNELAVWCNAS